MIARALSASGLLLAAGASGSYLAYTLGEHAALLPVALRARGPAFALGLGASVLGLSLAPWRPSAWLSLAVTGGLTAYALKRQWLMPPSAPRYVPTLPSPSGPNGLVLVLPDGGGVRLRVLARDRVALVGPWLVVHCGLARSVAVFNAPDDVVRAVLPHRSGFWLNVGRVGELVDGVDGVGRDSGQPVLRRLAATVRTEASWRAVAPEALLHAPLGGGLLASERRPRVPSARGVADGPRFGVVDGHSWRPVDLADPGPSQPGQYVISRWAARARGCSGTE
ncbi:MAG: hypothetical protein IV100_26665 [Myxococcales bacterium]|nr:hypothetical protein [Myxococcales bacterium]